MSDLPSQMHPGQLQRLAENTLYHYDAAYYYKQLAEEVDMTPPIDPQPDMENGRAVIRRGPNGNGSRSNGNGASKDHVEARADGDPPVPLTPEEIAELQRISDIHLEAAVMLDEVIAEVASGVPGGSEILGGLRARAAEIERAMPKRGDRSVMMERIATPRRRH